MSSLGSALDALMFLSLCGLILTGLPVVFVLTGCAVAFAVLGSALGVFDPFLLRALAQRVFGTMTSEVLVAIPLFVFMGIMLERSKIAEELLETMGMDPIWLGVLIAINLQTSFLTPPFGFALFYLAGVAPKEVGARDIYRGIVPFVALQLLALSIVAAFPGLATWLPRALF